MQPPQNVINFCERTGGGFEIMKWFHALKGQVEYVVFAKKGEINYRHIFGAHKSPNDSFQF